MGNQHALCEHVERSIDLTIEHVMCDERVKRVADLRQVERRKLMKFYWDAMPYIGRRLLLAAEADERDEVLQRMRNTSTVCTDIFDCEFYRAYISANFQPSLWQVGNTMNVFLRADEFHVQRQESTEHVINYLTSLRLWTDGGLANPPYNLVRTLLKEQIILPDRAELLTVCLGGN